jgi:predicted transcriptional regulator
MRRRSAPEVRIVGRNRGLRLHAVGDWDSQPLDAIRECCRAQTALAKATWQTVRKARQAGHTWTEIGDALGVTKQTAWARFSGEMRHPITGEEIEKQGDSDA